MRLRFVELGLITALSPRRPPGGNGRHKPPPRAYGLTEHGRNARDAYRAMECAQRERAAIAGITAARHADIIDPIAQCPSHPKLMAGECLPCEGNGTWMPKTVAP
jgi:hypothetical protein